MKDIALTVKGKIKKLEDSNIKLRFLLAKLKNLSFWSKSLFRLASYFLLFDLAFIFLFPFLHMVITSLKTPLDIVDLTVKWIPRSLYFQNYEVAIKNINYFPSLLRTIFVTVLATIGHVVSCSMIAYGFARYKFPFRDSLFNMVLLTIVIPVQTIIISLYIFYSNLGVLNTYIPLIVPTFLGFGLRGGLFIFIFKQFFMGISHEMEEAARIDGCGAFRTYWNIVLPIADSALLVCTVLSIVWHWNDYVEPTMYISFSSLALLPAKLPGLYTLLSSKGVGDAAGSSIDRMVITVEGSVMAATFLVILPILIVYLFLQKKFMESVERTGLVG